LYVRATVTVCVCERRYWHMTVRVMCVGLCVSACVCVRVFVCVHCVCLCL